MVHLTIGFQDDDIGHWLHPIQEGMPRKGSAESLANFTNPYVPVAFDQGAGRNKVLCSAWIKSQGIRKNNRREQCYRVN